MDKIQINEILNKSRKRKEVMQKLLAIIIIIVIFSSIIFLSYFLVKNDTTWTNNHTTLLERFDKTEEKIDTLLNQIEELKNKQKELENKDKTFEKEIKNIKISKSKATTTSRGGSGIRSTKTFATPVSSKDKWVWANVSAYCACKKCCGKTNGITASGVKAKANHTIAAPSTYKFGTKIEIEGMGIYTVEDRGGAITGNKIDVFFNSHSEALKFGRRNLRIKVVE